MSKIRFFSTYPYGVKAQSKREVLKMYYSRLKHDKLISVRVNSKQLAAALEKFSRDFPPRCYPFRYGIGELFEKVLADFLAQSPDM
jgi:hypothetical protein